MDAANAAAHSGKVSRNLNRLKDFAAEGFLEDLTRLKAANGAEKSGFCILSSGLDALCVRAALIDAARDTIDIQYYLFHDDASGSWLAEKLLQAADRGVKVRVLIDDINLFRRELKVGLVDRHENIEVRRFNPFTTRHERGVLRWTEMAWNFTRANRRMHNKSLIVDNVAAVIGGRNIGDEYFEIHPHLDFFDLDLLAVGPIADELRRSFEGYWNSRWVRPISRFKRARAKANNEIHRLRRYFRRLQQPLFSRAYAEKIAAWDFPRRLKDGNVAFVWDAATVVADPPEKVRGVHDQPFLYDVLRESMTRTETELNIVSPYFIPGREGVAAFEQLRERNVAVSVLTNSLSSNNWPVVHSGYSRYRAPLLRSGVTLFELKRSPAWLSPGAFRWFRPRFGSSSGACLHAKYFVFDRKTVFVGSFNLDPRSILFNTELGLLIESRELAEQLATLSDAAMSPAAAYRVEFRGKKNVFGFLLPPKLAWISEEEGVTRRYEREPKASRLRCFLVWLLAWLPIEKYL